MERKKLTRYSVKSTLGVASMAFLVIVAALVGGCGGGEQATEEPAYEAVSSADEQTVEETTEPEEESAAIGEPITVGDAQWTVTDAEQLDELVSRLGNEEGSFVTAEVTFVNNSNQDVALAAPSLALVDSEGREFDVAIESNFFHVEPERNMFIEQIKPGDTMEGLVIFAVEPDASGFKLRASDATNFVSNEYGYIDLGF